MGGVDPSGQSGHRAGGEPVVKPTIGRWSVSPLAPHAPGDQFSVARIDASITVPLLLGLSRA